jgi:hypothetical protein
MVSFFRLKVELDEKVHDLEMAQRNLNNVTQMLEEKSNNSESHQHERLKNIAGEFLYKIIVCSAIHQHCLSTISSNSRIAVKYWATDARARRGQHHY